MKEAIVIRIALTGRWWGQRLAPTFPKQPWPSHRLDPKVCFCEIQHDMYLVDWLELQQIYRLYRHAWSRKKDRHQNLISGARQLPYGTDVLVLSRISSSETITTTNPRIQNIQFPYRTNSSLLHTLQARKKRSSDQGLHWSTRTSPINRWGHSYNTLHWMGRTDAQYMVSDPNDSRESR